MLPCHKHTHTHIRTGYTHLHCQSPTHTHSHAETLLTRSVGFSFAFCVCLLGLRFSLVVAAVCGLRCQVTSYQFRTPHPLSTFLTRARTWPCPPTAIGIHFLSSSSAVVASAMRMSFWLQIKLPYLFRNPFVKLLCNPHTTFPFHPLPPSLPLLYSPVASLFNFFILASCKYEK